MDGKCLVLSVLLFKLLSNSLFIKLYLKIWYLGCTFLSKFHHRLLTFLKCLRKNLNLKLELGGQPFHILVFPLLFYQLFFMTYSNLLKHLVTLFNVLFPLLHLFLFFQQCLRKLLFSYCNLSSFFSLQNGIFLLKLLRLSPVLRNLVSR